MFFFYFAYKLVSARRGKGWGYFNGAGGNTKQKVILCWLKMGIRMHLQAQEIKERVLTALIPDSCCDRCMTILMTRGMRSDFFFSRCKIPIYFKSKSVKKKKKRETGNRFLVKKRNHRFACLLFGLHRLVLLSHFIKIIVHTRGPSEFYQS